MGGQKGLDAPKLLIVLARCYRALATAVERSISSLGLCLSDFMVLEALLHKGPLRISEIQAKVLLASGSMTAAVDRVESMGLAVRKTTAEDRRARVLELTVGGRRLIQKAFAEHAQHLERAMSVLTDEEKRALYVGLSKLGYSVAATLDRSLSEAEHKQKKSKPYE
jgi:MarR family transcriptional regulator, 2-MHQ and catechol-resistance regulon repressor